MANVSKRRGQRHLCVCVHPQHPRPTMTKANRWPGPLYPAGSLWLAQHHGCELGWLGTAQTAGHKSVIYAPHSQPPRRPPPLTNALHKRDANPFFGAGRAMLTRKECNQSGPWPYGSQKRSAGHGRDLRHEDVVYSCFCTGRGEPRKRRTLHGTHDCNRSIGLIF